MYTDLSNSSAHGSCDLSEMVKKRANGDVMISEEDWRGVEETIYLMSIPGMTDSILKGVNTPREECVALEDLDW